MAKIDCPHSVENGQRHTTACALGLGNGNPSRGVCTLVCRLGKRQDRVLHPSEYQSTPEGAARRSAAMYPAPTREQLRRMRLEARLEAAGYDPQRDYGLDSFGTEGCSCA